MFKPTVAALAVAAAASAASACLPLNCTCTATLDFDAVGAGCTENRRVTGAASACYDQSSGFTTVGMLVAFLRPGTDYRMLYQSDGGGVDVAFRTNFLGMACVVDDGTIGNATANPVIYIYRNASDEFPGIPNMDAGEERVVADCWF